MSSAPIGVVSGDQAIVEFADEIGSQLAVSSSKLSQHSLHGKAMVAQRAFSDDAMNDALLYVPTAPLSATPPKRKQAKYKSPNSSFSTLP